MAIGNGDKSLASKNHYMNGKSSSSKCGYRNGYVCEFSATSEVENTGDDDFIESFEETPYHIAILTYLGYFFLIIIGHIRDFLRFSNFRNDQCFMEPKLQGYVPMFQSWENFYSRNIYRPIRDCWNIPLSSGACVYIDVAERITNDHGWNFELTGRKFHVINFGSYNYLGFSELNNEVMQDNLDILEKYGLGVCAGRQELGYLDLHRELDTMVAEFLGTEAAITIPMGFATNSLNMPALVSKGCLILSDELNHTSIILGSRLSGATIHVYKHNNMNDLEMKLCKALYEGQPRTHLPWKKILIVVEGVYSMEGSIVRLPEIVRLKKKYKAYIYLDEAHSVGSMGTHGRGVVDYFHLDPADVDVIMGTFTKSFNGMGGYIAGSKTLINHLKTSGHSAIYAGTMCPVVVRQIMSTMNIIIGRQLPDEGQRRIRQLAWNVRYFRKCLHNKGFIVYGNRDSPVVPILVYMPSKLAIFSRECLKRGLGTVVVGFPATPIIESRVRFCISAAHTKEMLDQAIQIIDEVGDMLKMKYSRIPPPLWTKDSPPIQV